MRVSLIRCTALAVFAALTSTASAQQPAAGIAPDARAIVERHLAALGADDPSVTSMRASGTLAMPAQGISGTVEITAARPNKTLLRADIAGIGKLESAFDGERGWTVDPIMGPALLTGAELEQARFDAVFAGPFYDLSRYTSMTAASDQTFDERQMHRIIAVNTAGETSTEYFDAETGLHSGSVATRQTAMGPMEVTSIIRDYRKAGASLQAHQLVQQMMGVEQVITLQTFEFNVAAADTFAMPPAVKALIKR